MQPDPPAARSRLERLDGRLHVIHETTDGHGRVVSASPLPIKVEFHLQDAAQLLAGSLAVALPVALSEEVWDLGAQLSAGRTLAILLLSVVGLAGLIWALFYGHRAQAFRWHFLVRGVAAYLIPFGVSLALLWLFDKAPADELQVMLTRAVLVAFPTCFAATAVDFMK